MPKIRIIMLQYRNIRLLLFAVLFSIGAAAFGDVEFSIRYFDKKIYYPESDIHVKVTLLNNSPTIYRFRLSDNRAYSIDFDARNMANLPLPAYSKFIIDRNSNQPVFFREMLLEPGEEFSFTVNLKEFVKIDNPGMYTIRARFFPELHGGPASAAFFPSNILQLSVRPSAAGFAAVKEQIDQDTGEILRAEPLPPDQVVKYFISARQQGQWEKFFLYLDLESLYQRSPEGARTYRNLSEAGRIDAVKNYRDELRNERIDNEILTVPREYEIIKTSYTSREGIVEVIQKFAYSGYREVKLYTYYLTKSDSIWKIYNYEVQNRGTE